LAVTAVIVSILVVHVLTMSFVDYWPPQGNLEVERTDEKALTFTMSYIWGADGAVSFSDCAFVLEVDNRTVGPTDMILGTNGYHHGLKVRMFEGPGMLNASVVSLDNVIFIVTIDDVDDNEHFSLGDIITVQSTEPMTKGTSYSLTVITEVSSSWSYGEFKGTYIEKP
jgi:hypothetical protein